ncbi:MAG TPA: FAD-dependent oxidoreductase [Chloroflexota bacterium]|nr:FAD-dependent oxidoreductase [Chloroflexota bacterium]
MKDYRQYSFWLETAGDDLTPRPALEGSIDVDVAILGAGYTGLWTAYYLLQRDPSLKVAVLEREIAGFGASGRNGGWCSAGFPVSHDLLEERYGRDATRSVYLAMCDAVDEVGRVCAAEGIDAHYHKGGALRIARGTHQLPAIDGAEATYSRLGLDGHCVRLDAGETNARVRVAGALGSVFLPDCARIHPGRLVRGLARAVERRGATIYEQTHVTRYETGRSPRLITPRGEARARTIVLAGEAYLTRLPPLHRQLIPVYSLITLSEPLSAQQWEYIGWRNQECISSHRLTVDYLSRTADGRILFGSRGAPYAWDSTITDAQDRHGPTHRMIREMFMEWFPSLHGINFTHAWGGPVGMPRDWMPTMSYDAREGVATSRGYTGQGVATTNLAGRVLTDLITGKQSELTTLPMVGHRSPDWEPEPLRWLAVRYMQWSFLRLDARAERTGRAPSGRTLAERLGRH